VGSLVITLLQISWKCAGEIILKIAQYVMNLWQTRMRGNALLDGRPLLPPSECYWVVNASSLNYGRWVGQNSGSIFRRLWTKVHRINSACAWVSVVCNAIFWLTMSCCFPEIFAIKSRSCAKFRRNFDVFGHQFFGGPPKLLTAFYKSGSPSNVWQSLVTIGQATSKIRWRKKKKTKMM